MSEIRELEKELQAIRKSLDKFAHRLSAVEIPNGSNTGYAHGVDKVLAIKDKLRKHTMSRKAIENKYAYLTLLYSLAALSKENSLIEKQHIEKIGQVIGVNKMGNVVDSLYDISERDILDSAEVLRKRKNVKPFLVDAFILLLAYEEKNNKVKRYLGELITILGSDKTEVEHAIRVSRIIICHDKIAYNNYRRLKYRIDDECFMGWIDALGWKK